MWQSLENFSEGEKLSVLWTMVKIIFCFYNSNPYLWVQLYNLDIKNTWRHCIKSSLRQLNWALKNTLREDGIVKEMQVFMWVNLKRYENTGLYKTEIISATAQIGHSQLPIHMAHWDHCTWFLKQCDRTCSKIWASCYYKNSIAEKEWQIVFVL